MWVDLVAAASLIVAAVFVTRFWRSADRRFHLNEMHPSDEPSWWRH